MWSVTMHTGWFGTIIVSQWGQRKQDTIEKVWRESSGSHYSNIAAIDFFPKFKMFEIQTQTKVACWYQDYIMYLYLVGCVNN